MAAHVDNSKHDASLHPIGSHVEHIDKANDISAVPAPVLNLPQSTATVRLQVINTTTDMVCESSSFVRPLIPGHEKLNFKTLCFLVENSATNTFVLFDCGGRKDFWNGPPSLKKMISDFVPALRTDQGVDEILTDSGFDLERISAIVWSHWHWDHIGDASKFPSSTDIIVGPGFTENFVPGYPENPDGVVLASDLAGRQLREISFNDSFKIGQFKAHDYFGDGSFYLLDVPGHAVGHMCGLARTTPTTFAFLGGDCCHYAGAFRPTVYAPLPKFISSPVLAPSYPSPCPCSMFTKYHPAHSQPRDENAKEDASRVTPFYEISREKENAYTFPEVAQHSINALQPFDANPDVFVCLAHDGALFDVLPLFNNDPKATICDWKEKGYKDKTKWGFLIELPKDSKPGRPPLVVGLIRDGKRITMGEDMVFRDVIS